MKLFFSLLLLFNTPKAIAVEAILIQYSADEKEYAQLIQETFLEQLFIPASLIKMKVISKGCEKIENIIWQICFKKRELYYPVIEKERLEKSYQVFWK